MIDRWYGVACDYDDCGAAAEVLESVESARAAARAVGWAVAVPSGDSGIRARRDFCPDHKPEIQDDVGRLSDDV